MCELTGQKVVIGRNVSHTKGHPTRTSRKFIPNLKDITFKSEAVSNGITLQVSTRTIRTINKYGGIDAFLINCRNNKLSSLAKVLKRKITGILVDKGLFDNVKIIKEKSKKPIVKNKRDSSKK
jgi:large subunit ribosomal protein L28